MLQQILADQDLLFFLFHAFLIGSILGYFIANRNAKKIKKQLKSQSEAYEQLMNSLETFAPDKKYGGNYMDVIKMDQYPKKVSGLTY